MIIDAMDILYSGQVNGFCLVSSDSDFTRLAARLRESGMIIVGMGERKTPKPFISACNRFKYLDILATAEPSAQAKPAKLPACKEPCKTKPVVAPQAFRRDTPLNLAPAAPDPVPKEDMTDLETIKLAIQTIAAENSDEDDWMFIGTIGNLLVKRYPDFDVRNFGFSKLTPFIESLGLFDIKSVRTQDSGVKLIYVKPK